MNVLPIFRCINMWIRLVPTKTFVFEYYIVLYKFIDCKNYKNTDTSFVYKLEQKIVDGT